MAKIRKRYPTSAMLHAAAPRITQIVMNTTFRMFPDSAAAKGEKVAKPTLSPEAIAQIGSLMQLQLNEFRQKFSCPYNFDYECRFICGGK